MEPLVTRGAKQSLALSRRRLLQIGLASGLTVMTSMVAEAFGYPTDLERAWALPREAGLADGTVLTLLLPDLAHVANQPSVL
jgi:hypothetical protein